ncbi:MAG: acyclic terpene utilization AtuA family protein [Alphaproteobacteria bacterium]|nr:acyclic terpene utilization AtuA family protein [Alphaproteobacteria bacterium]
MEEVVGLAPSGSLGSGYNLDAFRRGLDENPDFIGQDAGSTDMGPYYNGTASLFLPRATYKHDLSTMLKAARERKIPLIVGSVFTSGARKQLDEGVAVIKEIAAEAGLSFRMAVIDAELDKADLKRHAAAHRGLESLGPEHGLTADVIDRAGPICAQMGVEPIIKALEEGAEVVIAGRACDDVLFAALPIMRGFDRGLALHMGKILECAGISAVPCDLAEPLVGRVRHDHFVVRPGNPEHRCTPISVAAHSLYERGDPCIQPGPGGINDLTGSRFEQEDERTVRVVGSKFIPDKTYKVKLEGAEFVGFRSIVMVGIRDAVMIRQLDAVLEEARQRAHRRFPMWQAETCHLDFHVYGRDAVMRGLEPNPAFVPQEVGLLIEAVSARQELANAIAMFVRGTLQHASYPGIVTTAGNLAYPFSPFNVPVGPAYRFSVYHLLPLEDPCAIFPMQIMEVRN